MKRPQKLLQSTVNLSQPQVASPPHLASSNIKMKENKEAFLELSARATRPDVKLTVSITGIDPDWRVDVEKLRKHAHIETVSCDPATNTIIFEIKSNMDFVGGPIIAPPQDSDFDLTNVIISVTELDPETREQRISTKKINVIVDAVVNEPELFVVNAKGHAGEGIPLQIYAAVTDIDGSEEITSVIFENIPQGAKLSSGADLSGGRWSVLHKDLDDLTLMVPYAGVYPVNVIATAQEVNINGFEYDFEDNVASVEKTFEVIVLD